MAILDTKYGLSNRTKKDLATGLDARWLELIRDKGAGYSDDNTLDQRNMLISSARDAFALGIIAYLPKWAVGVVS